MVFSEGDEAEHLIYVVDGTVSVKRSIEAERAVNFKLGRHHLNEEKGDIFTFEEVTEIRVCRVSHGTLLGAVEFGAARGHKEEGYIAPKRTSSATASSQCVLALEVPYGALHQALHLQKAVGLEVMTWLAELTAAQVLDTFQTTQIRPFRCVVPEHVAANSIIAVERQTSRSSIH
eukprot:TRINITY_DN96488_c0_g1_i1.p1 TRINITY_DN96488_c0_g1~~TRINITY_DN96488_c0_g1_i1.p1  ORF type:complete len:175 (+),score=32.83 TRINITY_DN96488_c0_g1_i1:635-1159(+)